MLSFDLFSLWILCASDLTRQVWGREKLTADGFMKRAQWQMVPTDIYGHVLGFTGWVFSPFSSTVSTQVSVCVLQHDAGK